MVSFHGSASQLPWKAVKSREIGNLVEFGKDWPFPCSFQWLTGPIGRMVGNPPIIGPIGLFAQ